MGDCWQNWVRAFIPLTGTSDGAYAIRPYPFGRKIETVRTYEFKKQSCTIDRQGRGVLHTPYKRVQWCPGDFLWVIVGQTG